MPNRVASWLLCVSALSGAACFAQTPRPSARHAQRATAAQHAFDVSAAPLLGMYAEKGEPDVQLAVMQEDGKLTVEGVRSPKLELKADGAASASGPAHFTAVGSDQQYEFQRDAAGNVVSLTIVGGRRAGTGEIRTYIKTASTPERLNHFRAYTRTEVMVPMRDGVKLHTVILRPEDSLTGDPLPFAMQRTPYGVDGVTSESINISKPEMAQSGYIFVAQDIRGRYKSEGQFVMNRPMLHTPGDRTDTAKIDESTDTYDTVDWLVKNVPNNNAHAGVYGVSYPGFLAIMAALDHHPAVKAVSPQAPMTDVWLGDDFFHNGAFRETYGFDYVQQLEAQKTDKRVSMTEDTYNFFLRYGNFENAARAANMAQLPTAKHFIEEPAYTRFWRDMSVLPHLQKPEVPVLEVGGYFDQEDMFGTQAEYAALRSHEDANDPEHKVYMVLGPWNHGGWSITSRHLGALDFGGPRGDEYRKKFEFPFFEKFLKGRPGFSLEDTATFRTGANQWKEYAAWPPVQGFHTAKLYLQPSNGLGFNAPRGKTDRAAASFVADPSNPVPYRQRPVESTYGEGSRWRPWLSSDQSFLKGRKDLLNFQTAPLEKDTTLTGDIMADIFASTTGSDADWIVKLIDVYPDDAAAPMAGYQAMVVDEIFRGRYRAGFDNPTAMTPGKIEEYKWSLHGADHTFRKGHRILVQVQSSWFPLYDRNPQTFVPNIMKAPSEAYKAQTHTIYFSQKHPSHLDVMVPDGQ